jgi:hypothetical protein
VDAVVAAVQEYTGQQPLFQKVFKLIKEEGAQNGSSRSAAPMSNL